MENKQFDEYELSIRNVLYFRTLIIIGSLLLINGFINLYYVWASPAIQSFVICKLTIAYFAFTALKKDVYFDRNFTKYKLTGLVFILIGILNLFVCVVSLITTGISFYFENGLFTEGLLTLLIPVIFIPLGLLCMQKSFRKTIKLSEED